MADPWAAFPDAPKSGADPWAAFPDAKPVKTDTAARLTGQVAQNANDQIAAALGYPGDLLASGMNAIGIPGKSPIGSEALKNVIDYTATLPGRLGDAVSTGSLAPLTESRTSRFEPASRGEKIAAGVGTGVGALASTLLPAGVISRAAPAGGLTQRIGEALASQPVMQTASAVAGGAATGATDNPYVGLGTSLLVPVGASAARGVVSPVANRLNANEQRLVGVAQTEGIPLTPAQTTGSRVLQGLEETMGKLPLSSGPMQNTYTGQREALNRAVMARTGAAATDASPGTLTASRDAIGQTMDNLVTRTTVNADPQLAQDLTRVAQDYGRRLETNVAPVFQSYMDDLAPLIQAAQTPGANPQITGQIYARIREDIGRDIRSAGTNPRLQQALRGIQTALDDAVERSAPGPLRQEWQEARRQYAAQMTVERAMSGGTQADRSAGNVPLGAFAQAVKSGDKEGYARARGQYGDLAKLADYLAPKIPDSGTPTRGMWANLLTGGALLGGGATAGSLGAGAVAAAAPYAISRLYNSPLGRAYLTNQVAGNTDFVPLLAGEGARQGVMAEDRRIQALARALMRTNEQRAR